MSTFYHETSLWKYMPKWLRRIVDAPRRMYLRSIPIEAVPINEGLLMNNATGILELDNMTIVKLGATTFVIVKDTDLSTELHNRRDLLKALAGGESYGVVVVHSDTCKLTSLQHSAEFEQAVLAIVNKARPSWLIMPNKAL